MKNYSIDKLKALTATGLIFSLAGIVGTTYAYLAVDLQIFAASIFLLATAWPITIALLFITTFKNMTVGGLSPDNLINGENNDGGETGDVPFDMEKMMDQAMEMTDIEPEKEDKQQDDKVEKE